MLVSEAITLMSAAAIKQLAVKDDNTALLGYINLGILELYKRFNLWKAEATITQADGTLLYTMADGDANVSIDLSDNVLIKILKMVDADDKEITSFTKPKYNQIKFSEVTAGDELTVTYQAAPIFLTAVNQEIPIPSQFLDPLFLFVAYKAHISVKGGLKDENNTHYLRFDKSCELIDFEGLDIQDELTSTKFNDRGFV